MLPGSQKLDQSLVGRDEAWLHKLHLFVYRMSSNFSNSVQSLKLQFGLCATSFFGVDPESSPGISGPGNTDY